MSHCKGKAQNYSSVGCHQGHSPCDTYSEQRQLKRGSLVLHLCASDLCVIRNWWERLVDVGSHDLAEIVEIDACWIFGLIFFVSFAPVFYFLPSFIWVAFF